VAANPPTVAVPASAIHHTPPSAEIRLALPPTVATFKAAYRREAPLRNVFTKSTTRIIPSEIRGSGNPPQRRRRSPEDRTTLIKIEWLSSNFPPHRRFVKSLIQKEVGRCCHRRNVRVYSLLPPFIVAP
jgi:hypothetical protein